MSGPWSDADFRKLWAGQTISAVGFHVTVLAMQLTAAVTLDATPFEMGLLVAAQSVPALVVSPLAGAWTDRLPRRPILVATDLGRAALLLTIPLAWLGGWLSMEQLYVVGLGMGTLTTLFDVAVVAYLPSLVGRPRLLAANSAIQSSAAAVNIGAPGLAGVLVQWLTAPVAIAADAVSYVVSAASVVWIRRAEPTPRAGRDVTGLRAEIMEGFHYLLGSWILRRLAAAGATYAVSFGVRSALSVLYLIGPLGLEPVELGVVWGATGVGALLGATAAGPFSRRVGIGHALVTAHLIAPFAALTPAAGFLPAELVIPVLIVSHLGIGFWSPIYGVNETTLRQSLVDDRLLGRVGATSRLLFHGVTPVGALAGGALAAVIGLQAALFLSAAGAAAGVLWFLPARIRSLR
ncbi:MAG: MFS transporter [Chloroflexota bacterium]|nr:MFS transporter [Chloroflexota bacterium]